MNYLDKLITKEDKEAFNQLIRKLQTIPLWQIANIYVFMNIIAIVCISTAYYVSVTPAFMPSWINKTGGGPAFLLISIDYLFFPLFVALGAEKIANVFIPLLLLYRLARWLYKKKFGFSAQF